MITGRTPNERTKFIRKSQKNISPHKVFLAISTPVFCALFCGEMAETAGTVQLPYSDYESLLELFRYLYSDDVKLSGSNVMQVLYVAKKYVVPPLIDKCTVSHGTFRSVERVLHSAASPDI